MEYDYANFPDDCWKLIFDRLREDRWDLESISLVSKQFLSLSNRFKLSLSVSNKVLSLLPQLLRRFHHIKNIDIDIHNCTDLDELICQFSGSGINLEALAISCPSSPPRVGFRALGLTMKNLKVLDCSKLVYVLDSDLILIANLFPGLEEICINAYNDDESGVNEEVLTNVTDDGVEFLASKLKELKKIDLRGKFCISDGSLVLLSLNCVKLREIHLCIYGHHLTEKGIDFVMQHCHNLTSLSLSLFPSNLDNNHAFTVGSSETYSNSFTFDNSIMKNLHTLSLVDGISVKFLYSMAKAHPPLKKLKIKSRRLVILLQACQLTLQELTLLNPYLTDSCWCVTDEGIGEILKSCPVLTHLKIFWLGVSNVFERYSEHSIVNLKSLEACGTKINDEAMANIGNRCPCLRYLDISYCKGVTNNGVMEVVRNCKRIREINLNRCENVSANILPQMMFSRPSLKKITPPCGFDRVN
ncbi:hypothetical protein Acr_00g0036400 [Actinidia rufa]|uniref:RNI-like superfamily protein n=1 Tax=Actinidia rufa TaxID=165716 RepID=A0A7J0DGS3_9ERIC|nr:hypothetical protein Acr_00g0036400 [Actinidia rufa]